MMVPSRCARAVANAAVVIDNSPDVQVLDNTINLFQFGVVVEHGDSTDPCF
jgi:hypothetical protein